MSETEPRAAEEPEEPVVLTLPAPPVDDAAVRYVEAGLEAERVVYVESFEL